MTDSFRTLLLIFHLQPKEMSNSIHSVTDSETVRNKTIGELGLHPNYDEGGKKREKIQVVFKIGLLTISLKE